MSRGIKAALVGGPVVAFAGMGVLLLLLAQAFAAAAAGASGAVLVSASQVSTCGPGAAPRGPVQAIDPSGVSGRFTDEQKANAARIVEQVKVDVRPAALHPQGATVALATAMQESNLHNIHWGDRDSIGLFQQRRPWGSDADRMDPHTTTHLFLTGGRGGQRGLLDIKGWQNMPVTRAAQAVQVSAFPMAYAKWERAARALAGALLGATAGPASTPSPTAVDVSCPTDPAPTGGPVPVNGWTAPLPAKSWVMTSPFGWRMHPVIHAMRLHTGDDLSAPNGTPVYAVAGGTVKAAAPNDGYGNQVVVAHSGADSAYNHLSVILVRAGQPVKAGQLVGKVGSTGMSTGNHLHFEIRIGGKPIDPVPFMRARGVKLDIK